MPNIRLGMCLAAALPVLVFLSPAFAQTTIPAPWAQRLFVGDINGDGKPDLVMSVADPATGSSTINVLLGNGDGTFSAPITTDIPGAGLQAVVDYNGDGKLDLVLSSSGLNLSSIALGNGDGTFRTRDNDLIGLGGWFNVVADFNGDGKPDLLIAPGGSHGGENNFDPFAILFNDGNGKFTEKLLPPSATPLSPPIPGATIAIGDVNLDGKADIVTTAGVFLSNGDGSFQAVPWNDPAEGLGFSTSFGSAIADLNGDGNPDIIYVSSVNAGFADATPPAVVVLFGNGDGTFRIGDFYVLGGAGVYQSMVVADFDLDGAPDVALGSVPAAPGEVGVAGITILQNHGDGTLRNTISVDGISLGSVEPLSSVPLSVADFNGDGKPDIALIDAPAASAGGPSASTMAAVLLNNAQLQFPVLLGGVVNAASGAHAPLSPGSLASAYTLPQPFKPEQAGNLPLPTTLGGFIVWLGGERSPLLAVSPTQVNLQVPWDLVVDESPVSLSFGTPAGNYDSKWGVNLATFSAGIFTMNGKSNGQGAVIISNSSALAAPVDVFPGSRPAARGEYISIFCTGLGPVTHQPASGAPALADPLSNTESVPDVSLGGVQARVQFSGLAPGFVGVDQVNVQVPTDAPSGSQVPLIIRTADGSSSNTVTIAIE